jgi:hypothetical protein
MNAIRRPPVLGRLRVVVTSLYAPPYLVPSLQVAVTSASMTRTLTPPMTDSTDLSARPPRLPCAGTGLSLL